MLDQKTFVDVIKNAPLVSIDLIVNNTDGQVLLGRRCNAPAQGYWFVPGGRIRKNEALATAFKRLCREELGLTLDLTAARFVGCFEHFYPDNFAGIDGIDTHYVVLAYQIELATLPSNLPDTQHSGYCWFAPQKAGKDTGVHAFSRAYFKTSE